MLRKLKRLKLAVAVLTVWFVTQLGIGLGFDNYLEVFSNESYNKFLLPRNLNLFSKTIGLKSSKLESEMWQKEQSNRKTRIQETCAKYETSLNISVKKSSMIYDYEDRLLYCKINKVMLEVLNSVKNLI